MQPPPRNLRGAWLGTRELVVLSAPIESPPTLACLTRAEAAVANLALAGLTNEQIAASRAVAVSTVRKQLESVYRKLGIGSRAGLAALTLAASAPGRRG